VIVVGAGSISNAWFPPIKAEELEVAAVVDLRIESAQAQIDKYQLSNTVASNDLDKTLRDVKADFVLDLTIPQAHCEVTCKALAAGFHVIGEKPMAATMDDARKMVAASENSGNLYMVSQSRRQDALRWCRGQSHNTQLRFLPRRSFRRIPRGDGIAPHPRYVDPPFRFGPHVLPPQRGFGLRRRIQSRRLVVQGRCGR
jgi:hypothetical protein